MCGTAGSDRMRNVRSKVDQMALIPCRTRTRAEKNVVSQSSGCLSKTRLTADFKEKECIASDLQWTDRIPKCPVYHPTVEEFKDPLTYIEKIAPEASMYGICKIVSPLKASVPAGEVLGDYEFSTYVQPLRLAEWDKDDKITFLDPKRMHTYQTFKNMANEDFLSRFHDCSMLSPEFLEKQFWKEMFSTKEATVEYAANVDGSAFSNDPEDNLGSSKWNLKILPKLPDSVLRLVEHEVPGITSPMLYIGMLFSMFAWHVEDHYLYSINYHHCGAPKTWYGVPGRKAPQFEKVVLDRVYTPEIVLDEDGAFDEIARRTTLFPPSILLQHGVPVFKAVQMPGEFVITFPKAYHGGFSNGFSCGEAVNFATDDWFPLGAEAGDRYACLGKPVILPYEELLCKEILCLSTRHEGLDWLFENLGGRLYAKNSFIQHMKYLNNAFLGLTRGLGADNLISLSKPLPCSHGTVICSNCKRDCYLAFLECSACFKLHCLFHATRSFHCRCGGVRTLYLREEIWGCISVGRREADEVQHRGGGGGGGKSAGSLTYSLEGTKSSPKVELEKGDMEATELNKRGFQEQQISLTSFPCKRIRTSCRVRKNGSQVPKEEFIK